MPDSPQSLTDWRAVIKETGMNGWQKFYQSFIPNFSISNYPRFKKALKMYGDWPMFEAIIATSERAGLEGDPLGYVIAVAKSKWKEQQEEEEEILTAHRAAQQEILFTQKISEALRKKMEKARSL